MEEGERKGGERGGGKKQSEEGMPTYRRRCVRNNSCALRPGEGALETGRPRGVVVCAAMAEPVARLEVVAILGGGCGGAHGCGVALSVVDIKKRDANKKKKKKTSEHIQTTGWPVKYRHVQTKIGKKNRPRSGDGWFLSVRVSGRQKTPSLPLACQDTPPTTEASGRRTPSPLPRLQSEAIKTRWRIPNVVFIEAGKRVIPSSMHRCGGGEGKSSPPLGFFPLVAM
jgi:hypothetical protein